MPKYVGQLSYIDFNGLIFDKKNLIESKITIKEKFMPRLFQQKF